MTWPRGLLVALIFSKFFYTASMSSYYTFYLIDSSTSRCAARRSTCSCSSHRVAFGTVAGGALGDRFGRKLVIWASILGVLPFTLAAAIREPVLDRRVERADRDILASAFPAIVVYGQELMPLKVGTVAGLFFGLAFGLGGIGAALIGHLADATSIQFVFKLCSFLPAIGLLAALLPHIETSGRGKRAEPRAVDAAGAGSA